MMGEQHIQATNKDKHMSEGAKEKGKDNYTRERGKEITYLDKIRCLF